MAERVPIPQGFTVADVAAAAGLRQDDSGATFGADRLKNFTTQNLLDGLYAQGVPLEFLRQFVGDRIGQVTSALLTSGISRRVLDNALKVADSYNGVSATGGDLTKMSPAARYLYGLSVRGVPEDVIAAIEAKAGKNPTVDTLHTAANSALQGTGLGGVDPQVLSTVRYFAAKSKDQAANETAQKAAMPFYAGGTTRSAPPTVGGVGSRGQGQLRPDPAAAQTAADLAAAEARAKQVGPGAPGGVGAPPPITAPMPTDNTAAKLLIEQQYGWAAGLLDVPEIASIMEEVMSGRLTDPTMVSRKFRSTNYYKTTTEAERTWQAYEQTSPQDAIRKRSQEVNRLTSMFRETGYTPPGDRIANLANLSLKYGWTDDEVKRYIGAEVRYDPNGVKAGTLGDIKDAASRWLVPLSDDAMSSWAQTIVGGTKTIDDFKDYLRAQAKSMFPALGVALDDPEIDTKTYLNPYAQDTAKVLGINAADIDWNDPKWMRAINQVDPKTNQRTVMNRADWITTLMTDSRYGYEQTANGQKDKQDLMLGIAKNFGINI